MRVPVGVAKICNAGCLSGYDCGKQHKGTGFFSIPLIGTDTECPLAKYKAKEAPEPNTWEHPEMRVTLKDCNALCTECEYNGKGDSFFFEHCLDCPVQFSREGIEEMQAEARNG